MGRLSDHARERGVQSGLSSPLIVDDQRIGAVNMYSRTAAVFLRAGHDLELVLATLVAALRRRPNETAPHQFDRRIRDALDNREAIALQDVLMERHGF